MDTKKLFGFSVQISGHTELATLIRDWVTTNINEFPSDTEVLALIMTLLERAALYWFRLAPLEKTTLINREVYFEMVKSTFEGLSKGHLESRIGERGPCHHLDGRIVNLGDLIEIKQDDGIWTHGEYNWSGTDTQKPYVRTPDGRILEIIPGSMLRWPEKSNIDLMN